MHEIENFLKKLDSLEYQETDIFWYTRGESERSYFERWEVHDVLDLFGEYRANRKHVSLFNGDFVLVVPTIWWDGDSPSSKNRLRAGLMASGEWYICDGPGSIPYVTHANGPHSLYDLLAIMELSFQRSPTT